MKMLLARGRPSLRTGVAAALVVAGALSATVGGPVGRASADAIPSQCTAPASTQSSGPSFSASETLCRVFSDGASDGTAGVVDQRQFSLTVSDTSGLRDGQVVDVSWSGAHPTGGIVSQEQFAAAAYQEYPVVLMECHGVDSPNVPTSQRLSPSTCWTATPDERTAWANSNPLWSLDMYNSPADQAPDVNTPAGEPTGCGGVGGDQYWVPFVTPTGTSYAIGPDACSGSMPPEMINQTPSQELQEKSAVPSDTTYAKTNLDGTGSAKFTISTDDTNASLGCSQQVACSLVVVPIEGISCSSNPPSGSAQDQCESAGFFKAGQVIGPGTSDYAESAPAVSGLYWWSASNWQRRISVPLSFGQPANVCSGKSSSASISMYGSELMRQAAAQWNPYFCLNPKLFSANLIQTPEPAAKNLLQQGAIEAAVQGAPPSAPAGQDAFFTTPTVQAPVGVTGFAIAYVIDNANGQPYQSLRLDPRLLAKLLTESYPGTSAVQSGDTGIANNPLTVWRDPEFKALNPGFTLPTQPLTPATGPAATLFSILSQSDVIWSLTAYISADPEARAWLDGKPDPWGMVVNPAYSRISLPVTTWPLLDTNTKGINYTTDNGEGDDFCLFPTYPNETLVPDRPLIDAPQATLAQTAYNLQFSIAASKTCQPTTTGTYELQPFGIEPLGFRFLLGVVSLADAAHSGLDTAALQTYVLPDAPVKFTDPADRVFVGPSQASLRAAASIFQPNTAVGSWALPYSKFQTDPAAEAAYPGTMLMSIDVPTSGLPPADAQNLGQYLGYAASAGQTPGDSAGQLPAGGYLPMTAANGLGAQVAYTQAAAADVSAQNGMVPPLTPVASQPGPGGTARSGSHSSGWAGGVGTAVQPTIASGSSVPGSTHLASSNSASPKLAEPLSAIGRTLGFGPGLGGLALPLSLVLFVVGGVLSLSTRWLRGRRGR